MNSENGGGSDGLAPVIPLFGGRKADAEHRSPSAAHPAFRAARVGNAASPADESTPPTDDGDRFRAGQTRTPVPIAWARPGVAFTPDDDGDEDEGDVDAADVRSAAEAALLRRLRTRQLSASEARAALRERGLDASAVEGVAQGFLDRGYLDDGRLAEQLVHAAVTRKGQGRRAIAQALTQRGIPREVVDATIATLPDDDDDRALEFARTKARSLGSVDRDAALRRLMGQLQRRGYASSVAMTAAKAALAERGW